MERPLRLNDPEVIDAWQRIFRTPEGRVAYASLAVVVAEIGPPETCALHAHNGRRSFAATLMGIAHVTPPSSDGSENERREIRDAPRGGRKSRRHGPAGGR